MFLVLAAIVGLVLIILSHEGVISVILPMVCFVFVNFCLWVEWDCYREMVTKLFMYEKMVGKEVLQLVCTQTDKSLKAHGLKSLSYGEFLRWIGLWLLMATTKTGGV